MIRALIFDWGDTIMRDFPKKRGPMYLWKHVEWIPEAEDALKRLHEKFIMVIATNAGESDTFAMKKALKRVGADKYFSHFYSSKDLGYKKPDVMFFSSIAKHIHALPEECAMIGNIYEKDIEGAKHCGMFTVLFNENSLEEEFPLADRVITCFSQLPSIFCWNILM